MENESKNNKEDKREVTLYELYNSDFFKGLSKKKQAQMKFKLGLMSYLERIQSND